MKSPPLLFSLFFAALLSSAGVPQVPIPTQPPTKPVPLPQQETQEPESVFRINTQLVQIDAVVTGKGGVHADDLSEDDFELFVDGKKQPLSYFRLVKTVTAPASTEPPKKYDPKAPLPPASTGIKPIAPEEVHRTIAFVVDDLGMSFESMYYAREAMKKFIRTQMQEGDLIGIIRTGKGMGALQQFTTDRRVLNLAVEKLTWNPISRDMIPRFADPNAVAGESEEMRDSRERAQEFRDTVFSVGTLGAVNFVVRGLRELPGRKMVILLSDGFKLFDKDRNNTQVMDNLRRLTDLANRSSVVIYSIDTKGLLPLTPSAADNTRGMSQQQMNERYGQMSQANFESQDGLVALARETGGFAVLNNNDINVGVSKVMKDNESYYLLGFDPDDEQFDVKYRNKFHSIKIKLKRPGLQVRTRSGYFGIPETLARTTPKTRDQQFMHALYSPFGARDLSMQMTSFFFNSDKGGSFVRSLLHIDASKLNFTDAGNGEKSAKLEIVTFTFDENGRIIENRGHAFGLNFDEARYKAAMMQGFVYQHDTPITKPGAYQFRMVIRDATAEKLGAAGQFINVPDLTKNRLALSGLTLTGRLRPDQPPQQPQTTPSSNADTQPTPAVRRFARTGAFEYYAIAFNPQLNSQTHQPQLSIQVEVYQDGKAIFQSTPRQIDVTGQTDMKRIVCGGQLSLTALPPGDYLFHLIVTDPLAKKKYGQAEQWMDFSVR
ncbi:MAG: VWA domain-containing protein [Acidobacteria bacterium]|nr:VWA domain-containing protein [Acidobacteriota bacterium]